MISYSFYLFNSLKKYLSTANSSAAGCSAGFNSPAGCYWAGVDSSPVFLAGFFFFFFLSPSAASVKPNSFRVYSSSAKSFFFFFGFYCCFGAYGCWAAGYSTAGWVSYGCFCSS
jgi:hypothetical protein